MIDCFYVQVEDPDSKELLDFVVRTKQPELTLADVMNWLTFDEEQGNKFDANFMSFFND